MNLTEAREAVAEALSAVPLPTPLNVRAAGQVRTPKTGDGWVTVSRITPGERFGPAVRATLAAFVVAGVDEAAAETFVSTAAVPLLRAITTHPDLAPTGVTLEPQVVIVDQTATPLYALTITLTTETE